MLYDNIERSAGELQSFLRINGGGKSSDQYA